MVITVKWDNIDILVITKKHNLYISSIVTENIDKVIETGMAMTLIIYSNNISTIFLIQQTFVSELD